ncbi:MAG: glycerophosphodiester phosphodiesterase [Pseudomonadota bacterium]
MKKRLLILLSLFVSGVLALVFWPAPKPISHIYFQAVKENQTEIIAHGGGLGLAPANTLFALQLAEEMGADVLEVDVQQARDGTLVLRHDDTLDRTTNMTGRVDAYDWSDLRQADAGAGTVIDGASFGQRGIAIPKLDDALIAFPEARWVMEIKNDTERAATSICDVIKRRGAEHRVLVGSFHDSALRAFRQACPDVATSMASAEVRNFVIAARMGVSRLLKIEATALQIPVSANGLDLTHPRILAAAKARGLRVQYWTVNDPVEMAALQAAGADGLITDYVDRGLAVIER